MWATLLRVENPACAWCRLLPSADGETRILVLAHFPAGEGRVWEEVELKGAGWAAHVEKLRALPSVAQLAVLDGGPDSARIRLEVAECPLPHAVAASGAIPRFPFEVSAGHDEWLLIGEREQGSRFVEALRTQGSRVDVVSSREYKPKASMTDRQRELMEIAIAQGYFEVPRRVTLTKLAERIGIAKSTLSEALARGERHVLEDLKEI